MSLLDKNFLNIFENRGQSLPLEITVILVNEQKYTEIPYCKGFYRIGGL